MNKEDIQQFFDKLSGSRIVFKVKCHDCKGPVDIYIDMVPDVKVTINGGALYNVQTGSTPTDKTCFFRCDKCIKDDLVYSRSIGYLKPINQMHKAKVQEVATRSKFRV